jgi:predicted tellurium resistance membrane protein TerC
MNLFSFISLVFLEIILSIDNLIFISILISNVHSKYSKYIKFVGLIGAFSIRILLLFLINFVLHLKNSLLSIGQFNFSYKEIIFFLGGIFLIYKSAQEVYKIISHISEIKSQPKINKSSEWKKFIFAVLQVIAIDFVFSLDSILVAIVMVQDIKLIIGAVLIAMTILFVSVDKVGEIMQKHQNIKLLANLFVLALGVVFVLESFGVHVPKSYLNTGLFSCMVFAGLDAYRNHKKNITSLSSSQ